MNNSLIDSFPKRLRLLTLAIVGVGLLLVGGATRPVYAATITVNTTADELNTDGDCSLREAIRAANLNIAVDGCTAGGSSDTITLPAGVYAITISGDDDDAATGDLDIVGNLQLNGASADTTILDGNALDRIFDILPNVTATLAKVTIRNGSNGFACGAGLHNRGTLTVQSTIIRNNQSSCGGGIFNEEPGTLMLTQSTVTANSSNTTGGGIYNTAGGFFGPGQLTVIQSTISGNNGGLAGGGISNLGTTSMSESTVSGNRAFDGGGLYSERTLAVTNSTVSGNTADRDGGGVYGATALNNVTIVNNIADNDRNGVGDGGGVIGVAVNVQNTIIANNIDIGGQTPDCGGSLNSQGYNLLRNPTSCTINGDLTGNQLGVDPLLGPLQNNGGTMETHALPAGSGAIDSGNPTGCRAETGTLLTIDQRGFLRPIDGNNDTIIRCDIGAYEAKVDSPTTATPTPTKTSTSTATWTATATNTNTRNPTATSTSIATPTATSTATATWTATATNTNTRIPTIMSTPITTPTPTKTSTAIATQTATATNINLPIPTATATSTATAISIDTPTPTATPAVLASSTPTPTATLPSGDGSTVVQPDQAAGLLYNNPDGGSVSLQIAPGTVSQPTTLLYTALNTPQNAPSSFRFTGQTFTLMAYQNNLPLNPFTFQKPITLILTYTDNDVVGTEEAQMMLYFYDVPTGQWSTAGITVVQREVDNNRLIVTSTHLTTFALFAPFQPTFFYYLPTVLQE